jgi:uncharacterized protein
MMKKCEYWKLTSLLISFLALTGCTATSQPSKFYLLNSFPSTAPAIGKAPADLAIGIGPMTIPEYVDRPQIVTRVSTNELSLAEFHKWAEPLKDNIPQVLADNVAVLLKTDQVVIYPWKRTASIDYQVTIDITRFDAMAPGEAHLIARWYVFGEDTRTILDTKNSHFTTPIQGPDYAVIVSALNRTLDELSQAIATSIVNVHSKKKP